MTARGFDIASLLEFKTPHYFCPKCLALQLTVPFGEESPVAKCATCGFEYYDEADNYIGAQMKARQNLKSLSLTIEYTDLLGHSQQLAQLASDLRSRVATPTLGDPPMLHLFSALREAKYFVHFTSFGLGLVLMGALKMVAQKIPVRGVVSNAASSIVDEVTTYKHEARYLDVKVYEREMRPDKLKDIPHHKLIVIDGLLAFTGSANFTDLAWRKAADGLEEIQVVTDVAEVMDLHNRMFSRNWAKFSEKGESGKLQDMVWEDWGF